VYECRILAENVLHEGLRVKLDNLIPGSNTRQVSVVGVNKIKDMIRTVGWIPHKGIMYATPIEEHAVRCEEAFVKYNLSKLVGKVSAALQWLQHYDGYEMWVVVLFEYTTCYNFLFAFLGPDS